MCKYLWAEVHLQATDCTLIVCCFVFYNKTMVGQGEAMRNQFPLTLLSIPQEKHINKGSNNWTFQKKKQITFKTRKTKEYHRIV